MLEINERIMKNIDGVAFDLEGPIINLEPIHFLAQQQAARKLGAELLLEEALAKVPHLIGGSSKKRSEEMAILFKKFSAKEFERLENEIYANLISKKEIKIRPKFLEYLSELRMAGIQVMLGTSTEALLARRYISQTGLDKIFYSGEIVVGDELGLPHKPDPAVFLETARRMNVPPNRQLVFEDSISGVKAGLATGSEVIGIPAYWHPVLIDALYKAGASKVIKDWTEAFRI